MARLDWRRLLRSSQPADAIDDEIREHLDQRTADLVRQGVPETEARRRARVEFGAIEAYKDACRDERRSRPARLATLVEQLWREGRLAVRRLRASPVFTTFAVTSLALGLGVTTAIYSTMGSLLWSASSIEDADHLVVVTREVPGTRGQWRSVISKPDFDELRARLDSVPTLGASSFVFNSLNDGVRTSPFVAEAVTGNYFSIVRLPVRLGRGIQEADDRPGADAVVVLSNGFWRSNTGSDAAIIGRTVRIGSQPFVVVGVAAEGVKGLDGSFAAADDGWIALTHKPATSWSSSALLRSVAELAVVGRLPPKTSLALVRTQIQAIGEALDQTAPILRSDSETGLLTPVLRPWSVTTAGAIAREQSAMTDRAGLAIVLLVGLVLVVACTNIANLTLGRGTSREHEFSVRRALGASRWRLVREQCAESVVLALCGGFGALLVARVLFQFFTRDIPIAKGLVIPLEPRLDAPALIATGGVLLVSLIVFGVGPALQLTRATIRQRLAGESAGPPPGRWKGRRRLIAWQVTISTALILIAAVSMRAVAGEAVHDPGFDVAHTAVGNVQLFSMHWDKARRQQVTAAIERAARAQSGFESTAVTSGLPIGWPIREYARLSMPDRAPDRGRGGWEALVIAATPGVFQTFHIPIVRGRIFDDHDTEAAQAVIVLSERVAVQVFGTADVVGRQVSYRGELNAPDGAIHVVKVVGVARETDTEELFRRSLGTVYLPLAQHDSQSVLIVGRVPGDPAPMVRTLAGIARQADPDLAVNFAATGPMAMTPMYVFLRAVAIVSAGLAILAVTLAMIGLYGVLSHVIGRRTREIGLRLALGAEASRVRRMVVAEGLHPVVWGLGLGLLTGVGARMILRAIYAGADISPVDPFAFSIAAATLVSAGVLACYLPARRASQVDPNVALRDL